MSRKSSLNQIFEVENEYSIQFIKASGDCLYDCLVEGFRSLNLEIEEFPGVINLPGDSDIQALRRTVSENITDEDFANFQEFFAAGLSDFSFMKRCREKQDLQDRMLVCGKGAGAGHCIWANEFEIGVLCNKLGLSCLIVDMQASSLDSRFISVQPSSSESEWFILLQRTRREHYNLIKYQEKALMKFDDLPEEVKLKWKLAKKD
ncbi:uncharacterized protein LOC111696962 [Eurytemora carolleeae]|uniref:uncharacterized protein LOC111696962 n=1 Tax=Eurytemora carolleeae TaxID=1294199 RepID=UPI000C75DB82|nr:uncharacterized protein LOC111696962 [Eurytemora carolleeae]|eukprot:XP_023322549.1 uncharacterized protein LOC111696962 [Eurytemora affinis]